MANVLFSFEPFQTNEEQAIQFTRFGRAGEAIKAKQDHVNGTTYWSEINYLCTDYNFNQYDNVNNGVLASKNLSRPYGMYSDPVHMEIQSLQEPVKFNTGRDCHLENSWVGDAMELAELNVIKEHVKPKKEMYPISSATLELLKSYTTRSKRLNRQKIIDSCNEATCPSGGRRLSTEDVMRLAGAHYIQHSYHLKDDLFLLGHPSVPMLSSLTDEEIKDVELAHLILAAAEKICNQQYDRAGKLLTHSYYLSSNVGNPVQRVAYHFAGALQERIDRETGRMPLKDTNINEKWGEHIDEAMMGPHPALLACHRRLPFSKVLQFTEIQAILDNLVSAKKIHLIDLGVRIGIQWTTLMQALAARVACPLEHVKISAVGTSEEKIMKTSEWLASFAETLNLPFSFKAVVVTDMKDIKEDLFELEADEVVGVYAPMILRSMLVRPDCLENLMEVMKNLNPAIMIVTEVEGNHNSPSFINRFTEALFFYSVWFDCFNTCMEKNDDDDRMLLEENFFSQGIRSVVATEGSERIIRHVGIDIWRSFIMRFGFVETELSQLSLDQANLVVKQLPCGSYCTLDMNGKALTVGWKGAPLISVSAWKLAVTCDII